MARGGWWTEESRSSAVVERSRGNESRRGLFGCLTTQCMLTRLTRAFKPRTNHFATLHSPTMATSTQDLTALWPANRVRTTFLDYFKNAPGAEHAFVPSSSTIPYEDPTLLFANAGYVEFKLRARWSQRGGGTGASSQRVRRQGSSLGVWWRSGC